MAKQQKANTVNMHGGIYINNIEHIEHFHAPTDNSTDNSTNPTQVNNTIATDPLSATALKGFIEAGLLDQNLMPNPELSNGEKGAIAYNIAQRLNLENFWPKFEQMWNTKYLGSAYSRFLTTKKYIAFQKRLNSIK